LGTDCIITPAGWDTNSRHGRYIYAS